MAAPRRCEIEVDGASLGNPGPAGIGAVLRDGRARPVRQLAKFIGETTNNVAEYLAAIYALQEALRLGYTDVVMRTDSELLARQLNGQYQVRDPQLRLLYGVATHLVECFARCRVEHIPREQNRAADRLAGQGAARRLL